jgi:hypothetical protein
MGIVPIQKNVFPNGAIIPLQFRYRRRFVEIQKIFFYLKTYNLQ